MVKRLRLLSKFAGVLGNVMEVEKLFPLVLEKLLHAFPGAERGCIVLCDPDGSNLHPAAALARPGAKRQISLSRTAAKQVVDTRSALLSADVTDDERFDPQNTLVRIGLRSVMCAPMVCENTVLGLIQLDSSNHENRFSKADMALFLGIAGHTALALSKARLHEQHVAQMILQKDLQMAKRIQHCFLPKAPPQMSGFRFAGSYAAAHDVGGDYYDFVYISDTAMGIVVGDVAGKGVAAALYMAKLSSEMRYHARGRLSAGAVLSALNRELAKEMESGMFVTMALLVLEPKHRKLTISSAGHPAPILREPDGSVSELQIKRNLPLGVLESCEYRETEHVLKAGDLVLLYTDGITEAMNGAGDMFGAARLKHVVSCGGQDPQRLLASISRSVGEHAAGRPQSDDLTMVCLAVD
jgi:serine phosphatase RsbU (regulator of sigma subunit)